MAEMKTIGLVGGSTWLSTVDYYRHLNRMAAERLGGIHCCRLILHNIQFGQFSPAVGRDDWKTATGILVSAAQSVERAGAECFLLCANTHHFVADEVASQVSIPIIHIVDAVGREIAKLGYSKAALLGTKTTMTRGFYQDRLFEKFGIETLIPNEADRSEIHRSIFEDMARDHFTDSARNTHCRVIDELKEQGAQAAILGCTEIPILLRDVETSLPKIDTAEVHCRAAIEFAIP